MYAVVQTGGKQYRVAEGDRLVGRALGRRRRPVSLRPVLLVDGDTVLSTAEQLDGRFGHRADRRRRQGPEDQRLHVQEQVEPAARTGVTASTTPTIEITAISRAR